MDTRKLMHYSHQRSAKHHLGYHGGDQINPQKLATFEKGTRDDDAYELVRRWNAYPELVAALKKAQQALADHRDGNLYKDEHGSALTLEEVKYLIVDPAIENAH